MSLGWTIVLDVGKTLSKASLWDETGGLIADRSRPNRRPVGGGLTLDVVGIEQWLESVLKEFAPLGPIRAIIPVAHGAGIALIRRERLACAPLDYEWPGVARERGTYEPQRDAFPDTGSPALPAGLNLGMQLHWLESLHQGDYRDSQLLPWAQYWAWCLCGVPAAEFTSLGCHSDLWRPYDGTPSKLAERRGWVDRLAPLRPAGDVLGTLKREWMERTGLSGRVNVYCGLHDSNAALLATRRLAVIEGRDATVLSTGTWFVAMRSPQPRKSAWTMRLPETRDCLVNVDVEGAPVPSARFMGGREIELLTGVEHQETDLGLQASRLPESSAAAQAECALRTIEAKEFILPSAAPGVGPYPNARGATLKDVASLDDATAKAHLYAALVADASLDLIGSRDTLVVEGRFSRAHVFVSALAALRPETTVLTLKEAQGVARGALGLVNPGQGQSAEAKRVAPLLIDIADYRARWRDAAERLA